MIRRPLSGELQIAYAISLMPNAQRYLSTAQRQTNSLLSRDMGQMAHSWNQSLISVCHLGKESQAARAPIEQSSTFQMRMQTIASTEALTKKPTTEPRAS
jgi:hypothetical protein